MQEVLKYNRADFLDESTSCSSTSFLAPLSSKTYSFILCDNVLEQGLVNDCTVPLLHELQSIEGSNLIVIWLIIRVHLKANRQGNKTLSSSKLKQQLRLEHSQKNPEVNCSEKAVLEHQEELELIGALRSQQQEVTMKG